jgi:hypothetical protein
VQKSWSVLDYVVALAAPDDTFPAVMCDAESLLFKEELLSWLHRPYWAGGAIIAALADETRAPSNMKVVSGMARCSFMESTPSIGR